MEKTIQPSPEKPSKDGQPGKKKSVNKILLAVIALLLAVMVGLLIWLHGLGLFLWPWESSPGMVGGNLATGELDFTNNEELARKLQELAEADHVTFQLSTKPVFEDGLGDLLIQNPAFNLYDLTVEIYLGQDETGLLVYESGRMQPGTYIDYDSLNTTLNRGEHEAIAFISFWDGETLMTTASADMTLVIES